MNRIDERHTMFARMNYKEGTYQYEDYYEKNKDKKTLDDEIRKKPNLCSPGTMSYDPINSPMAEAAFMFLQDIHGLAEKTPSRDKVEVNKDTISKRLKGLAIHYGACLSNTLEMKDYHYYSHRGRQDNSYGEEIKSLHPYGVVFAVEMDKDMINRGPQVSEIIETSKAYVDVSIIGMIISYYIRSLGYEARNHMDANYLVVAPLVALDGGIGDIGRNGIITTRKYGSRVRLGVVTTNMPLNQDPKDTFGLDHFCNLCRNCSIVCPGKAIEKGDKTLINNDLRWQINQENCYDRWRSLGTDCGICISSCPFSQGVDMENIKTFENNREAIKNILNSFRETHKIRPYIKDPPLWLK
ncbi:4Fe-4S dicluster domain-containing protein [Clostridium hydrogeniformans]|uniref:4Fe-4S dicluster domain-containing protein n=1 Tax=Clostridium hydrogeniformans TaxID=349933 RepID=UPI000484B365|nr:reductive dehalogenase domain-containing protein [Clostridium hydrogeniformans]